MLGLVPALLLDNLLHLGVALLGASGLLLLLHLQERLISRHVAHHLGWRAVLVTGWLGVPLHELSHLIAARVFGHRLIAWKLLDPDPVSGTLGYVRHAYSRRSLWQLCGTFFIGVAPVLSGGLLLALLLHWMLPGVERVQLLARLQGLALADRPLASLAELTGALGAALWRSKTLLLPVQIYLLACVAHHLAPSAADLKGSLPGLLALLLLLLLGGLAASAAGRSLIGLPALLAPLLLLLPLTTLLLGLWALLASLLARLQRPLRRRLA